MIHICIAMQAKIDGDRAASPSSLCARLATLLGGPLFRALADPGRALLLVRLLERRAPCTVSQLAAGTGADLSVVSRQLSILREAGVVQREKRGKEVWCSAQASAVAQLLRQLADALEVQQPGCTACPCAGVPCPVRPATAPCAQKEKEKEKEEEGQTCT
jgi:ArsR family transcriptional regulator